MIVDVLDRRRTEGLQVTDADLQLIARALGPSDDSAMSALWERFDGAGAPARFDEADLRTALSMAIRAPSIHNSQPWRWRIRLSLRASSSISE